MGLALGLCLVSGASVVLMVAVPEPGGLAAPAGTGATAILEEGDDAGSADPAAEREADEEAAAEPESEEDVPVLLRSVEEEVDTADGVVRIMDGEGEVMGEGPLLTFAVEVEKGLPGEAEDFTAAVEEVLGDPRSWGNDGERSLQRVDGDDADIRVLLAAPDTVDRLCAPLRTNGFVSCASGNRAVINQNRWVSGVEHFDGDLETYRIYLINHEVGHTLGRGHVLCPGGGEPAPVMQQQTLSLQGCEPNGWVHPGNG
ncbi:hypothetical protein BJF83_03665 [Nocardiopsis sp. CNR-923]|uniref:DUF3152 domain-containing protein n=1 Tax=Nocardiopsis sp. CNR-923 TaxID=1904965 RepID=UPI0009602066|nr:DUF3152 domain-containing protein [Nocardiopsis sp. CNR-923]OLT26822.1 hypothetical protein BJF83_03665 [Nocardiopsis sp. CNR-923]